jgi:hypothetical protein
MTILIEIPGFIGEKAHSQKLITYFRAVGAVEYAAFLTGKTLLRVSTTAMKAGGLKERRKELFRQIVGRHPITDDESDALGAAWDLVLQQQQTAAGLVAS